MKDTKKIERLFQEKFKDFEAIPPQDSWDIIASRLNEKKKKKRVIPFWFQLSGIAASVIIIGSLIWNYQSENSYELQNDNNNGIVFDDLNRKTRNNSNEDKINAENSETNQLNNNTSNNNKFVEDNEQHSINKNVIEKSKNRIVSNPEINQLNNSSSNKIKENTNHQIIDKNSIEKSKNRVVSNPEINNKTNSIDSKFKTSNQNIVFNLNDKAVSKNNNNLTIKNLIQEDITNSKEQTFVNHKRNAIDKILNQNINTAQIEAFFENENSKTVASDKKTNNQIEVDSIKPIIVSTDLIIKDSTLVEKIAEKPNPLEELLAAKEAGKNENEKEEKQSKWAISTNASPVYFNSLAEGSSIDEQFNSNEKNYTTTLSYGLAGIYSINKKLSIKTGVNNINLSYNTNDVVFDSSMREAESNIPTISRNADATNMVFSSTNKNTDFLSSDVENVVMQNNVGALKQNISYIEVPLELSYKLLDKKFGIEFIGGMSTLFLNNNTILLATEGGEMNVGKANNLNNIHFSSNVGLGFKYAFWKSFNANFQPMFKYQINTFSENSGNFKPYFIGLYTGIGFSF